MAYTYVYGTYTSISGYSFKIRPFLAYEFVSQTATTYSIRFFAGVQMSTSNVGMNNISITCTGTGQTTKSGTYKYRTANADSSYRQTFLSTWTWTWSKTTSAATKTIKVSITHGNVSGSPSCSYSPSIPSLCKFTVTFYGNGATYDEKAQAVPTEPLVTNTYYYNQTNFATYGLPDYDNGGTWQLTKPNHSATGYWLQGSADSSTKIEENEAYATTQALYLASTGNAWDGLSDGAALSMYAEWQLNAVEGLMKISGAWEQGIFYLKSNGDWVMPYECYMKINGNWQQI